MLRKLRLSQKNGFLIKTRVFQFLISMFQFQFGEH